jgi:hypothetical protein
MTANAAGARIALGAYIADGNGDPADPAATLADLLADLMHALGADMFDRAVDTARLHYADETAEAADVNAQS